MASSERSQLADPKTATLAPAERQRVAREEDQWQRLQGSAGNAAFSTGVPGSIASRVPSAFAQHGRTGAAIPVREEISEEQRQVAEKATPDETINAATTAGFIDDGYLAERLEWLVARQRYDTVLEVLDRLRARDKERWLSRARTWWNRGGDEPRVTEELAGRLTDFELQKLATSQEHGARELLDRLYYGLPGAGWGGTADVSARLAAAKSLEVPIERYRAAEGTLVLPYAPGMLTVTRLADGSLRVRLAALARVKFPDLLPGFDLHTELFGSGLVLAEDTVVGLKDYDNEGRISHVPAFALAHLGAERRERVRKGVTHAAELSLALGTLGLSVGAGAVAEGGTLAARAVRILNTAMAVDAVLSPLVEESREWIIRSFGEPGRQCLQAYDLVQDVLAIYGLGQLALHGAEMLTRLVDKIDILLSVRAARKEQEAVAAAKLLEMKKLVRDIDEQMEELRKIAQRGPKPPPAKAAAPAPADFDDTQSLPPGDQERLAKMKTIGDAPPARTLAALHEELLAKTKTVPDAPPARALVRDVPAGTPGSDVIDALKPGGKLGPPPAASSEARATLTPSEERAGAAALDPLTEETRQAASKKKQKASRPDAPKKPPASTGPANAPRWPDNKINADQLEKRLHAGELELVPEAIRNDPRFDALSTENAGITGRGRIEAAAGITAQRDASQQIVGLTRDPSTVDEFLVTFSPESGKKPLTYDVKSFYRHPEVGLDAWKTQTTADIDSYLRRGVNLLIDESFMTPRELAVVRQAIQESSLPAAKNVLRARVSW